MMAVQTFGGPWTEDKLNSLADYLRAYTTLFKGNEKAKKLTRIFVDAFAGSGYRAQKSKRKSQARLVLFPELSAPETQKFLKGSARIALEVEPSFHRYVFIERDKRHAKELEALKKEFPAKADCIKIVPGEANRYLRRWCAETDWRYERAVVFLDPYGMQVEWATIEAIAKTKGIDLWFLFPLGSGVIRLLTRARRPRDAWAQAISRILGTEEWMEEWYPKRTEHGLFGEQDVRTRDVDWQSVGKFVVKRLESIFAGVANNPLVLRNSKNVPLYLLCFVAGNEKGAKIAIKIAQHILGR